MTFLIRKMTLDDTKQVQQVATVSWNATYDGIIPFDIQQRFLDGAYNEEMMRRRIENSLMLVAEQNGKVVGFANFSRANETGESELAAIYLYPDCRGVGIGTALLNEGIRQLEGVQKIFITVEKENQTGKNFYTAKGFEVLEEFDEDFDGHTLKSVRMALTL